MEPWCDLEGKVVLVTGASAGLGREFCTDLAKAGCYIIAAARRADRLKSLCDDINGISAAKTTTRAVAIELDVTANRKIIEAAVQKAWAIFGRIDVLINNAGIRVKTKRVTLPMENRVSRRLETWCDLEGKVVLVTGASAGLGREFCANLAKAGCFIVAAARRADRLKSLCDEINGIYTTTRAVAIELDVAAARKAIEATAQKAWDVFGRIDVLINNAEIRGGTNSSLDISQDEWEDVFKTNLEGAWMLSKYIGRHMRDAGQGGLIINISTGFGLDRVQQHGSVAYGSSKAGMNHMAKVMALELGRHKIRVNAIAPAIFPSEITAEVFKKKWFIDVAKKIVPLQTSGTLDPALTSVIRYLIHNSSQYVTGNIFIVDCGATLTGIPIFSSL